MATEVLADSLGEEWKVSSAEGCVRVVFGELKMQNFYSHALVLLWCAFGSQVESFSCCVCTELTG